MRTICTAQVRSTDDRQSEHHFIRQSTFSYVLGIKEYMLKQCSDLKYSIYLNLNFCYFLSFGSSI